MTETRIHFHDELGALEQNVLAIGDAAINMLHRAAREQFVLQPQRLADFVAV